VNWAPLLTASAWSPLNVPAPENNQVACGHRRRPGIGVGTSERPGPVPVLSDVPGSRANDARDAAARALQRQVVPRSADRARCREGDRSGAADGDATAAQRHLPSIRPRRCIAVVSAPPLLIPVPFKVSALVVLVMVVPFKSSTAPLVTLTLLVPSAVALPTFNVPR